MGDILKDSRFTKLINDPRYRQIPKAERKVKIDKRFQSMFDSEKFKVKYTVDKRGKPVNQSSSENLRKYYDLGSDDSDSSDDEEDDNVIEDNEENDKSIQSGEEPGKFVRPKSDSVDIEKSTSEDESTEIKNDKLVCGDLPKNIKKKLRDLDTDYARGDGVLLTDSSSDEESSEEKDDDVEHGWGELDADAETCDDATYRLAVCNMDWDNINASDIFVLFNSFLPPGGLIKSVTIYPSEFGLKRMKEEEMRGPIELTEKKIDVDSGSDSDDGKKENEEGSKYHMEKLRQYQLNRLKYYYAIVVFDSASTANKIYTDCDGIEYESSASKLDLRFVPDEEEFDQEVHDECQEAPDVSHYKPRLFVTTALQQAKVELTWDTANPQRLEVLKGAASGEVKDEDLKNYLAFSSSDEGSDVSDDDTNIPQNVIEKTNEKDIISKYKSLLQDIESGENKKKNQDMEMEVTWGLGLKEKTQELVNKKQNNGDKMTPFEEMVQKKKDKKKAKKLERKNKLEKAKGASSDEEENGFSSDDVPSDIDMNDPYFAEEFDNPEFKQKKTKKKEHKKDSDDEEEKRKRAELELLLDDDDKGKAHFSFKKIQEAENETKSMRKRRLKNKMKQNLESKNTLSDFNVDVNDQRFSALYTSHHYNIDPTDPNFKKTKGIEALIQEKLKRRPGESEIIDSQLEYKKPKRDAAVSVLINSIKRKTGNLNK